MIAGRRLNGLDCIIFILSLDHSKGNPTNSLAEALIEKLFENVVGHDTGVGIGLSLRMKHGGGGLVNAVGLAKVVVLVNHGIERAALYEGANLGHFRGGGTNDNRATPVPALC